MATFDMSFSESEPIIFKNLYGKDYTIPADLPLEFTLQLGNLAKKVANLKDEKEQADVMIELVTKILNLDESQQISKEEVRKFGFKPMTIIMSETMKQVKDIEQIPNLNSPSSK